MRAQVLSAVTAIIGFGVVSARADGVRDEVELKWLAPEPCPSRADFLASLLRMLGDRVTIDHTLFATVVITQSSDSSFQLKLTTKLNGASGQRVLQGRACQVVADAAAVTLALLLNPDFDSQAASEAVEVPNSPGAAPRAQSTRAEMPTSTPAVSPVAPPSTRAEMPRLLAPSFVPRQVPRSRWYGSFSSQMGLQLGVLSHASPQLSIGLGASRERASLEATAFYALPQNETLASPNVGGRLWTLSFDLRGCWYWTLHSPRFGDCLGAEVTRLHGRGTGVPTMRDATTYWVSPSGSLNVDFALSRHSWFRLSATGMVPLARPDTHLDDYGTVQKPSKILGQFAAGIVASF